MRIRRCFLGFVLLVLLLAGGRPAPAASPDVSAPGTWNLATPHPGDASFQTLRIDGAPGGGDAFRITVTTPSDPLWLIQIVRGIPPDIPAGHLIRLHFWARSATKNPLRATVEQNGAPYREVGVAMFSLTPTWQEFTVEGVSPGYGPNGLSAHFQAGRQAGVVEIAAATAMDTGLDPALADAQNALRPERIQSRIDKYRKGKLTVHVVNASGKPVPGVTVEVTQTRHAFLFGCNFFGLNPADSTPSQTEYRDEFAALFNYATLPFYWGAYEPQQGKTDAARLGAMADWCVAHGITPKGHPLIWHAVWPSWAPTDPDAAIPLLKARVFDLVPRYRATIHYWDVLNEANGASDYQPANGESAWIKRDGPASVVGTALRWARGAARSAGNPPETFLHNDYETGPPNVALPTKLQADGALPDAIGIQSHMHTGVWPLTKVWQVCQTFGKFGRPIHFTETTVLSGPIRAFDYNEPPATDWNTTPDGEAKQADYVVQFYTVLFSHPSVRAITWWDFSDQGAWLGAPAGLVHKDMTPKPAYLRLMDLIHHQWWTTVRGKSDRAGSYTDRVFYGDYRITATDAKGRTATRTVTFPEATPPLTVTLRLP